MAKFRPRRITQAALKNLAVQDGQFIYTHDTGRLYIDYMNQRKQVSFSQDLNGQGAGFSKYIVDTDINATVGAWYLCTSNIQITLPEVHSIGDIVKVSAVQDADNVSIIPSGTDTIQSDSEFLLDYKNSAVQLLWAGSQWIVAQVTK